MIKKRKYLFIFFLFSVLLFSCNNKESYTIKGDISGLQHAEIFFVAHNDSLAKIDTITASSKGKFTYHGSAESAIPVVIYMETGKVWITIWAENGKTISIKGDVNYPELILVKGGDINELLTQFKTDNRDIIKERQDIIDKFRSKSSHGEDLSSDVNDAYFSVQISNFDQILKNQAEDFVENHPASIASLVLIQDYIFDSKDPKAIIPYLSMIEGETRNDDLFRRLEDLSSYGQSTAIGNTAPDFNLVNAKNDTINLNNYKDKYLLLNFSASWCDPCKIEYDSLKKLRKDFPGKDLAMLTISLDENKEDWNRLAKEKELNWDQWVEEESWSSPIVALYNVEQLPTSYLIDKKGIIIGVGLPPDSIKNKLRIEN